MIAAMAISEPSAARYGQDPCSDRGCTSAHGARCEYVDRRGKECQTSWCPSHQYIVDGRVFCRRHAGIMVAILDLPDYERELPDLANRAPSLVEFMARRLHAGVVQLLQAIGAEHPGASIAADGLHATMSGAPRVRGWEHKWRLLDNTGPLATLAVRVDEEADSVVQVRVDGSVVKSAVPPWITEREPASPEADAARREAFDIELLTSMWQSPQLRSRGYT
jgi:hypothetical protein